MKTENRKNKTLQLFLVLRNDQDLEQTIKKWLDSQDGSKYHGLMWSEGYDEGTMYISVFFESECDATYFKMCWSDYIVESADD